MATVAGLPGRAATAALDLVERPLAAWQKRTGTGGMAAVFLAPNIAIFAVFVVVPLFINVLYSFTGGDAIFLPERVPVGVEQYRNLLACESFADPFSCREDAFWTGVHNTVFFMVVQVAMVLLTALITALCLNRDIRARGFWRAVFFFPVLLSPVVVGADLEVDPAAQRPAQCRARRPRHRGAGVAGRAALGDVLGDLRLGLGASGLLRPDPPRRPPGDPGRPLRGRRDGRHTGLARSVAHHSAVVVAEPPGRPDPGADQGGSGVR